MPTVTISGTTFEVYASTADADTYLKASIQHAAAWAALTSDQKAMCLVEAKRLFDAQLWQGSKTVSNQPLAWPRKDVVDAYGEAVSSATVPQAITDGNVEMAAILATDAEAATALNSGSNIRRVKAGPAEVEYFTPTIDGASKFPTKVQALVGQYLKTATAEGEAFGTDEESSLDDDFSTAGNW